MDSISFNGNKKITRGRSDNSATVKYTWDDDKLYIAFIVKDKDLVAKQIDNDSSVWKDDCVEVYISTSENKSTYGLGENDYQFLININNTQGSFKGKTNHLLDKNTYEGVIDWDADFLSSVTLNGTINDSIANDNGYIIEIGIYWKSINFHPKKGEPIFINFCVEDNDYGKPLGFFDYSGLEEIFARPSLWTEISFKGNSISPQLQTGKSYLKLIIFTLLFSLFLIILFLLIKKRKTNNNTEIIDINNASIYQKEKANSIIKFIEDNYTNQNLTAFDVADKVSISERHLRRVLKEVCDKSFTEIISEFRIEKGKNLLLNTAKPISEIAQEIGYNNYDQFARVFKKILNTTPSSYRKENTKY